MDYLYLAIPAVFCIAYGFWKYKSSIKNAIINMMVNVVVRVSTQLYKNNKNPKEAEVHRRYIKIPYVYRGKDYVTYLPYSRVEQRKMLSTKCFLVGKDGKHTDITQQPGCRYLVSVDMLGGKEIILENFDEEDNKIFTGNDIPTI